MTPVPSTQQVLAPAGVLAPRPALSNFLQLVVIHTVKGFSVFNEAEVDVFLEFSCSGAGEE